MSITERQQQILKLLESSAFITVNQLATATFTSPSSIRRDLTHLQNLGMVHRTHGGVTLSGPEQRVPTLRERMNKDVAGKRRAAKKAAALLEDGQTILLDGSSTVSFLLPYIAEHKGMSVFTNNLLTALSASEMGITTHCLGGCLSGGEVILTGPLTAQSLSSLYVDILFFSTQSLDSNGLISDSSQEEIYLRKMMLAAAEKRVFLCDSEKFSRRSLYKLTELDKVDAAAFDQPFPALKTTCRIL